MLSCSDGTLRVVCDRSVWAHVWRVTSCIARGEVKVGDVTLNPDETQMRMLIELLTASIAVGIAQLPQ